MKRIHGSAPARIFTFFALWAVLLCGTSVDAQSPSATPSNSESSSKSAASSDAQTFENTDESQANQNAIYERPFIVGAQRAAVGGYAEANLNYFGVDGIDEGPSFEFRRFNLFLFSNIGPGIRFLSELEFEHGTEEIKLETALVDVEIVPELVLRGGILLTPLGAFNQAHDAPIWDFVERPLVSTTIIPSTFSEVGFGLHGSIAASVVDLDYQLYATQGLSDGVLDNNEGRTSIPAGRSAFLFEEDNNNEPAVTGRFAVRYEGLAELGLSGWHGAYNTYEREGETVDDRRTLTIAALDFAFSPQWFEIRGEFAWAQIEVPDALASSFGQVQWGGHIDAVVPVWNFRLWGLEPSSLNVGTRLEYLDYHAGELANGDNAGEEVARVAGVVSFRPGSEAVFRLEYSYQWTTDVLGNVPSEQAAIQFGMATYF